MKELSFKLILNQLFTFINVYVGKVQQGNSMIYYVTLNGTF